MLCPIMMSDIVDYPMIAILSQNTSIDKSTLKFNSMRSLKIHISSHIPGAIAWNFASTLLLVTTGCFLLLQVTKFPTQKVQ